MRISAKRLVIFLATAFSLLSTKGHCQYSLSAEQIKNIALAYDSLDECKEVQDSLNIQIGNALNVIAHDSALISSLRLMSLNQAQIISGKDILILEEKQVSHAMRKKYRLWKVLSFVFGGLMVYQIVK